MAAGEDVSDFSSIKCSSCGQNIEISAIGDHICETSSSPPLPPPKSSFRTQPRTNGDMWSRFGRAEPPPRIDPLMANRPFLHPNNANNESLIPSPLSMSSGSRSPLRPLQRSHTTPLPTEPQSPNPDGDENGIPKFPLPRSMSERRVGGMALKEAVSAPPVPSPHYANAMRQEFDIPPRSAQLRPYSPEEQPPLPPLPKDRQDDHPSSVPNIHKHTASIDSRSSYGTSIASTRYGDRSSKRSTALSSRRPSFGSVTRAGYKYEDEIPPMPPSPHNFLHLSSFSDSSYSDVSVKREGKGEVHSGFDFGARSSLRAEVEKAGSSPLRISSNTNSERLSSTRGSAELFFRSPAQSSYGPPIDLPDPSELRSVSPAGSAKVEYKAFKPPGESYLQPNPPDHNDQDDMHRKNSDATSESAISVSNFARALGLDISDEAVGDLTASSESSPSETRSGTSVSSLPSEASISRRKPSDQIRLGPVVEDLRPEILTKTILDETLPTESPTSLEPPPRITGPLSIPDSPTDPTLGKKGSLYLISERAQTTPPEGNLTSKPSMLRSATEPAARPTPRPRGPCRGCGEMIMGKSISSADGRLTGRYHRACFVCFECRAPFQTSDFYVLDDRPYCAQHYHERNGSLCQTCNTGIEGQYLETNERAGRGPADRQKFHPECLRCRTCQIDLKGEYFEWNGLVYCERDARRAAASISPHRFRRPTMPSSPLAPPSPYGPPPPPGYGYPGGRGRGRGFRPGPGSFDSPYGPPPAGPPGARRFPERRTTKLMMI